LAALGLAIDLLSITLPAVVCRVLGARSQGHRLEDPDGRNHDAPGDRWVVEPKHRDFVPARAIEATRTDNILERLKVLQVQRRGITEGRSLKVIAAAFHDHCSRDCRRTDQEHTFP
jgi:hypothetical protein